MTFAELLLTLNKISEDKLSRDISVLRIVGEEHELTIVELASTSSGALYFVPVFEDETQEG